MYTRGSITAAFTASLPRGKRLLKESGNYDVRSVFISIRVVENERIISDRSVAECIFTVGGLVSATIVRCGTIETKKVIMLIEVGWKVAPQISV